MKICARPGCHNELNRGRTYCSTKCSALDRKRVQKLEKSVNQTPQILNRMPVGLSQQLRTRFGDDAELVVEEVNIMLAESAVPVPFPVRAKTVGDWELTLDNRDVRPGTELDFDLIDRMLRSGPVIFAMEMKRAQIVRVFAEGRYKIISPDKELAEVAEASLHLIMGKMADDLTYSAFAYGAAFMEEVWAWRSKYQLGMSQSRAAQTEFLVPDLPHSVKPVTVKEIKRDSDKKFDGFVQKAMHMGDEDITVSREQALVVPLNEHFRNLWGRSFLHTLYPIWLWYEIILRAMARYMERMSTPVALAKAPARGLVEVEGKTTPMKAMDMALSIAGSLAKSNAAAIPSDRDESGNPLWEIGYVTAEERAQPFISVLEYLGQEMLRAALSADRSLTQQSGGVGSQNIGEVHARASAMTSELILGQILHYLNLYFMPGFSLYNRGPDGPPIWIRTQPVDLTERELLMKLLNIAGNTPVSQEILVAINWREMAETSNIPLLTEEETEELKKKLEKEGIDKLKQQNELMQKLKKSEAGKMGEEGPPGQEKEGPPQPQKETEQKPTPDESKEKTEQFIVDAIVAGDIQVPWVLGLEEARVLHEAGYMSEEVFALFNPFHDRSSGRFASKRGGGGGPAQTGGKTGGGATPAAKPKKSAGGGGSEAAVAINTANTAKSNRGSFIKKASILGLGSVAVIALVAASSGVGAPVEASEEEQQDIKDRSDWTDEEKAIVDQILARRKEFKNLREAEQFYRDTLAEYGVELEADLYISTNLRNPLAAGQYDSDTGQVKIQPQLASQLLAGDPNAVHTFVHELLHSDQETHRELQPGEYWAETEPGTGAQTGVIVDFDPQLADKSNTPENEKYFRFARLVEGQNDLMTAVVQSKIAGVPIHNGTGNMAHQVLTGCKMSEVECPSTINPNYSLYRTVPNTASLQRSWSGYPNEEVFYAYMLTQWAGQNDVSPVQALKMWHKNGFDIQTQYKLTEEVFGHTKTYQEAKNKGRLLKIRDIVEELELEPEDMYEDFEDMLEDASH